MKEPVRILHMLYCMDRAGAETMVMNYYRNIDKSKVQFDFLLTKDGKSDYEDEILQMGGRIYHIPEVSFANPFRYLNDFKAFIDEHPEYKIIHSHTDCKSTIPLWVAKRKKVPVRISHSHTSSSGKGLLGVIKALVKLPIKRVATNYFACGEDAAKFLYRQSSNENEKIKIIPNAIDVSKYSFNSEVREQKRKEFNLDGKFVLGHVGRFATPKNHPFLIDIFEQVHKKNENAVLLLVGEGDLRAEIEAKVNRLGLQDSVIFAGLRSDIPQILQAMDIFMLPSLFEGLPVVLVEAQSAGLVCFTSKDRVTQGAKMTPLVNYISLDESPEYWADEILKYQNGYERQNTLELIQKSGYDIVENAKQLENYYIELYTKN